MYEFGYPSSPADVVEFFRSNYGPMTRAFASLGESAKQQVHNELMDLWSCHNRATDRDHHGRRRLSSGARAKISMTWREFPKR